MPTKIITVTLRPCRVMSLRVKHSTVFCVCKAVHFASGFQRSDPNDTVSVGELPDGRGVLGGQWGGRRISGGDL